MGLHPASGQDGRSPARRRFPSGIRTLDDFLEGGLPRGAVTEWCAPFGCGGLEALLPWVARATTHGLSGGGEQEEWGSQTGAWALWVHAHPQLTPYPPAWAARGVDLARLRFACSGVPLAELRPVFLEPLFRLIVLHAPHSFTEEDCAFVARQARAQDQVVVIVRDQETVKKAGSIWARLRVHAMRDATTGQLKLEVRRGLSPRQLVIDEDALAPRQAAPLLREAHREGGL
jgi:RecA/RadA recombinase